MQVFRLCKSNHVSLSGRGAEKYGTRWTPKGTRVIFAAESRALAMLEYAVHVEIGMFPNDLVMLTIELPERDTIWKLLPSELPIDWRNQPTAPSTRDFGEKLIALHSRLAYALPSAVIPEEYNFMLDPAHSLMQNVQVVDVANILFDQRLL